jgi:hypothetical protein
MTRNATVGSASKRPHKRQRYRQEQDAKSLHVIWSCDNQCLEDP